MSEDPRGLATLAFLKTRFDEGKDHLGLFEPFIADGAASLTTTDFIATDVRDAVYARSGLVVPLDTVQTLLGRLTRRGYLQRTGGRYFKATKSLPVASLDDAINPLVLAEPLLDSPLERSSLPRNLTRAVARFISQRCLASPDLRPALDGLLEGLILRDCLILGDIADIGQRFHNLTACLHGSSACRSTGRVGKHSNTPCQPATGDAHAHERSWRPWADRAVTRHSLAPDRARSWIQGCSKTDCARFVPD